MFRMMRAVPRMATLRQVNIKSQTVKASNHKVSFVVSLFTLYCCYSGHLGPGCQSYASCQQNQCQKLLSCPTE